MSFSKKVGQLSDDIEKNIKMVEEHFCHKEDLMKKVLVFAKQKCGILYLDPLVKKELLQSTIIEPLLEGEKNSIEHIVHAAEVKKTTLISEVGSNY